MNIYESLNYISKLAFPNTKYEWEELSIDDDKPIFKISIFSNKIKDYFIDHYEKGIKSILQVIENETLSADTEYYAKQLLVVLADNAIDYHSDICKNKPEIACKYFKNNSIFRDTVIEYSPHLYYLIPNMLACYFFHQDFNAVKDLCEKCYSKYVAGSQSHKKFIKELHDKFTYNHLFEKMVTNDNFLQYLKIANYINQFIPELDFFEVRDGSIIASIENELNAIKALGPIEKMFDKGIFWTDLDQLPNILEFEYFYPNGTNGDIVKFILEEYGETYQKSANLWIGKISKQHINLFEMLGPTAQKISQDIAFLEIYEHHIPSILYDTRMHLFNSKVAPRANFDEIAKKIHRHKLNQRKQRDKIYSDLIIANKTSPKWKSEAQLFSLVSNLYPDAVYQYKIEWLGMQSLDIYIPSLSVGIEYQGIQHYEPIEHFGGEEHFKHQQENDLKKKILCSENGVSLIEWPYTEPINEENLIKFLDKVLNKE